MTTKDQPMTQSVWIKKPFTSEQKIELGQKMADADERLSAKEDELDAETDAFKETKKALEGEMATIQMELHDHAKKFRQGYEEVQMDCVVQYEGKIKKFIDPETGAILQEQEMTEAEQMKLSGKLIDAEDVIRQARKED